MACPFPLGTLSTSGVKAEREKAPDYREPFLFAWFVTLTDEGENMRKILLILSTLLAVGCNHLLPAVSSHQALTRDNVTHTASGKPHKTLTAAEKKKKADEVKWFLAVKKANDIKKWIDAIAFPPLYLRPVLQCIKSYESGNYAESSHISAGSGAYQVIPSTWQHWSALAGYGGYSYTYLAPQFVQDKVVVYMLEHGGAHNWDPQYGYDPCTVNLP